MMTLREGRGKWWWPNSRYFPSICLEGLRIQNHMEP